MAQPLRTEDLDPIPPMHDRPRVVLVETAPEAPAGPEPAFGEGIARSALLGATIGFVTTTAGVTAAGMAGDLGLGASLGLGSFIGIWGGAGFGFMLGGTIPLGRRLEASHGKRPSR